MADIKSMSLSEAKSYLSKLKSEGKTESTSKEAGKVADYIKTLQPDKYGSETVASAYQKLSSGVTKAGGWTEANAEQIYSYTGKYPSFTTNADGTPYTGKYGAGNDLSSSLNNFQDTVFQNASSPQIREAITSEVLPDMAEPEQINRVETLQTMREEMGVADLEQQLNDLKFQLEEQYAQRRLRTQDAEGKPVSLGVIGGRVTEIERQENERIDAIGRQIGYITDQLNTSYNTISTMINYMGLDYQDAVAAYNAEYNRNLQLYKLVDEEMDEQVATARANLTVYANAITNGNMRYQDLSPTEKTMITKLEVQSGLPVGFISNLNMSFKDRLLGTSSDGTQAWIIGANGELTTVSTGLPSSKTSSGYTTQQLSQQMTQMFMGYTDADGTVYPRLIGRDGKVSPDSWQKALNGWVAQGGTIEDFKNRFGGYVNKTYTTDDGAGTNWYDDYEGFTVRDTKDYYGY